MSTAEGATNKRLAASARSYIAASLPPATRVLHVAQPEYGGVAEHLLLLTAGLSAGGFEVEVAMPPTSVVRGPLQQAGVRVHDLPMRRGPHPSDLPAARRLRALDRSGRFELVHAHSSKAAALARSVLARPRERVVYTPHLPAFMAGFRTSVRRVYLAAERALAHRCAAIVAVSEWEGARVTAALGSRARVVTIRNGVAPCRTVPPHPALVEFKGDRPLAGFVSRLDPPKRPSAMIEAMRLLTGSGEPPGRFALVGNGRQEADVRHEIERLGLEESTRWFPFEGDVAPYLAALDVFTFASEWESLPLSVLEAVSCGMPVVAQDVGALGEAVIDGSSGRLLERADPPEIAAALQELLTNSERRAEMGDAARALARDRFGIERMVEEVGDLYERVLAGSGAPVAPPVAVRM